MSWYKIAGEFLLKYGKKAWEAVKTIPSLVQKIPGVSNVIETVSTWGSKLKNSKIGQWAVNLFDKVKESDIGKKILKIFGTVGSTVGGWLGKLTGKVADTAVDTGKTIAKGTLTTAGLAASGVVGLTTGIVEKKANVARHVGTAIKSTGRVAEQGFENGLSNLVGLDNDAVQTVETDLEQEQNGAFSPGLFTKGAALVAGGAIAASSIKTVRNTPVNLLGKVNQRPKVSTDGVYHSSTQRTGIDPSLYNKEQLESTAQMDY